VRTSRFELLSLLLGYRAVDGSFVSYKGIEDGFEELCKSGAGSAEESGILQRHNQGCVEASRGLRDPKLPLSIPTGVQLLHLQSSGKVHSANSAVAISARVTSVLLP
jgi:hypothetical protein